MAVALREGALGRGVRLSPIGLQLPDELTEAQYVEIGKRVAGFGNAALWALADWAWAGRSRWKWGARYREIVEATGLDFETASGYAYVAGNVPIARRRGGLSFAHHREVAALDPPDQETWLERAEQEGWTRDELRQQIRESKALPPPVTLEQIRLTIEPDRAARWRSAAEAKGLDFCAWAAQVLDEAA